ncbi:helix-turn-helix domain-containing protein [Pseudoflavitalea sp. G-6-1-2]|uniref:AraC family transcriptional regulator n=1 Tax=Pseudoflavitalea sp. G-6-1-2 TaxID=2728841 RepID=UPI00146AAC5A|nr:helix-turn-helix domain-containing protein [Pseudoflavitalea sp. G-6-1-2]NML21409.1 helix-turn-helix domain-containing protein [Pseudoflavitalea sp. G-6-1-2]
MKFRIDNEKTGAAMLLFAGEENLHRNWFGRDRANKYFTIAWNRGPKQTITIDGNPYEFPQDCILTLLFDQSYQFEDAKNIVAWQFNREFYCIIDHDSEVSCVGFLFGTTEHLFIKPAESDLHRLQLLLDVFIEEFKTADRIQHEMLLVLLKRLIILVTKLARSAYIPETKMKDEKFHLVRKFNLLVEANFRTEHAVSFYAKQLFKSPKTLSNLFAIYNDKSPSQVIQERILIEAKRQLTFTDLPVKEIGYDLGFEDMSHFSNFFKKLTRQSPLDFRNTIAIAEEGKKLQVSGKSTH